MSIVLGIIVVILTSDFVVCKSLVREKRWDVFSRASEWLDDIRNRISEAADTVSGMTDALPPRTRERLHNATNHLVRNVASQLENYGEHFGNIALERLSAAHERLNEIHSRYTTTRDMRKDLT